MYVNCLKTELARVCDQIIFGSCFAEYGMGDEVWTQGDVCSNNFDKASVREQVVEIVDVQENYVTGDQNNASRHFNEDITTTGIKFEENIVSVLEIGVACSAELPRERMDIIDAVTQMRRIGKKHTEQH